jgi:hypothetical protein
MCTDHHLNFTFFQLPLRSVFFSMPLDLREYMMIKIEEKNKKQGYYRAQEETKES